MPWSKLDHCIIAWGGVIAQAVVALPIVVAVSLFGYSRFEPINAVVAILGFFSLGVALFNLLPIRPLDGSIAWGIIPEACKYLWNRNGDRHRGARYH
jgi:Zn-dependent protease